MVGGTVICDRAMAELDAAVLENAADGVSVLDCARVVLAEDITPELLRRLSRFSSTFTPSPT